ncbi:RNA polymerase sigma factor [Streptomyces sp. NPDC048606]|uniref:RNA polymerase sigma factor n=1 Tax=Streptomyces sp. NPDC048606 TaxID=3154726 RepID=UPI003419622C
MVGGGAEKEFAPEPDAEEECPPGAESGDVSEPDVAQRLLEASGAFMDSGPYVLRRSFRALSLATCQDVVGEALLRVGVKAAEGELPADTNVVAYLRATARNLAVDEWRREQRGGRRTVVTDAQALEGLPEALGQEGVDEGRLRQRELLRREIERMPEGRRRQVVDLQSKGLSDVEIAAALGIAAPQLHKLRSKAIAYLRRKLAGHIRDGHRKKNCERKDR